MPGSWTVSVFRFNWRSSGPAILIISDNPTEPLFDSPFLAEANVRLELVRPDDSCLLTARRLQPRLIIEDLSGGQGFGLCKRLREDPQTGSIPQLLITAAKRGRPTTEAPVDGLLPRPVSRQAFYDAVRRFVPLPRRRDERVMVNLRFTYRQGERIGQAFSRDVSPLGAFLKSDCLPPLGTRLDLAFLIPGTWDAVHCHGIVRCHAPESCPSTCRGFGLEFDDLDDGDAERLEVFIERYRGRG